MSTWELLQLEALSRGQTVEALMDEHRGTDTEIGRAVFEMDVEWLQDVAGLAMKWARELYAPERMH